MRAGGQAEREERTHGAALLPHGRQPEPDVAPVAPRGRVEVAGCDLPILHSSNGGDESDESDASDESHLVALQPEPEPEPRPD